MWQWETSQAAFWYFLCLNFIMGASSRNKIWIILEGNFRNFLHYLMPYIGPNWQVQLEDNAISSFWEQSIHMVCKYHYLFYRSWSNWRNCWILHFRFLEQGTFDNLFIACFIPPNSHFGTMIRYSHWIIEYLFWNSSLPWFFPLKTAGVGRLANG